MKDIEISSEDLSDEVIEGYSVMKKRIEITKDGELVWAGIISDAGGMDYGDFRNGTTEPEDEFEEFKTPKDLAEHFGLELEDLITA